MNIQFSRHDVLKSLSSPLKDVGTLVENQLVIYVKVYFHTLYSTGLSVCLYASTTYFDYCRFVIISEIENCVFPLCSSFSSLFWLFGGSLRCHMKFRMDFYVFAKKVAEFLIGNCHAYFSM